MDSDRSNAARHAHDDHEEFLLAVACGDLPRSSPEVLERLRACPACSQDVALQDALAGDFATWAREQNAVRRDLAAGRRVAGSDRVAPFLRARMAERHARQPRRHWVPLAAAAAVLVAAGTWITTTALHDDAPDRTLLGDETGLSIAVEYDAGGSPTVVWSSKAPAGGRYEVTWRSYPEGDPIDLPAELTPEPRWSPSPSEAAILPKAYEVVITVLDTQLQPLRSGSALVSR